MLWLRTQCIPRLYFLYDTWRAIYNYSYTIIAHHLYIIYEENILKRTILCEMNGVLVQCQICRLFENTENIKIETRNLVALKRFR